MKNRYTAGFLGLFLVCCIVTKAQEPIPVKQHITDNPFLFSQLPDRSDCIAEELPVKINGHNIHQQSGDVLIPTEDNSTNYLKTITEILYASIV